jgi:hypothetical protein
MRPLAFFERLLERAFERPSARLFRTPLRTPVIERRIDRAMELERRRVGRRTIVPDRYVVAVREGDLAGLAEASGGAEALAGALADASLAFARAHGYTMDRLPVVTLAPDPGAPAGDVRVAAAFSSDDVGGPGGAGGVDGRDVEAGLGGPPVPGPGAGRADPTLVFRPTPHPTIHATLLVREPGGRSRAVSMAGDALIVGRDPACGLVLDDRRASRQHARIASRGGFLVLSDLGSTNGTYVRDERISEVALGLGDVVTIGDSTIEIRPPEPATVEPAAHASAPAGIGRS